MSKRPNVAKKRTQCAAHTESVTYGPIKLDIGAGGIHIEGFTPIDIREGADGFPLDYPDASVDEIRASHVLEHFPHTITADILRDWYRALKPGGFIRIAVPNMTWIADMIVKRLPVNGNGLIYGQQDYPENLHMSGFTFESLREAMVDVGFERLRKWESEAADCASQEYSLNLAGYKPTTEDQKLTGVHAVSAVARFGPSLHHICTDKALAALGVVPEKLQGCFWHQNLSYLIEKHIADPSCEFVLTLDYDSIFQPEDVLELYRLMRAYPEADAIVPVEMKRGDKCPLFCILDDNGNPRGQVMQSEFDKNLTRIGTGHFGLTLFRASKLRTFQRPWMNAKPAPDGTWGDGHVDSDIDFWHNWRAAGNTLYLANRVQVGHLEEILVWAGNSFTPIYQTMHEFQEHGRPTGARIV